MDSRVEVFSYSRNLEALPRARKKDNVEAQRQVAARFILLKKIHDKVKNIKALPKGDTRSFAFVHTAHLAKIIAAAQKAEPESLDEPQVPRYDFQSRTCEKNSKRLGP